MPTFLGSEVLCEGKLIHNSLEMTVYPFCGTGEACGTEGLGSAADGMF